MTYKEAYDKIINAYFKDNINPGDSNFCFCGTLRGNSKWNSEEGIYYSKSEYKRMETALLSPFGVDRNRFSTWSEYDRIAEDEKMWEETLFEGMCKALDVLKEIHKGRNEIVDDSDIFPIFAKRNLNDKRALCPS